MNIKRSVLIITFLAILVWSFGYLPMAKAETMEEISAQIATLRNQITEYQKKIAELQIEIAKLLAKQISIVQSQIAQLQTELLSKTPVKPETEWKCPDLNADGQVDMRDIGLVSGIVNACSGQTKYNATADVDSNNCITSADLDYVTKYFGKKIEEITQCKGVVIIKPLAKPESECKCPDLDGNGQVDMRDIGLVSGKINTCSGDINYDPKADIDSDNCLTSADLNYVTKYFGKKSEGIAQCKAVEILAKPESECKCPDLDGNGQVDMRDIGLVSGIVNACSGQTKYNATADVDSNNCITSADLDYVTKYFGKKIEEISQCAGAIITHPTLSVTISANPSSGVIPLNGVDLTAKVWGTATGPINYTFYCNRTDTGTNITSGWCHKKDGVAQTSYTATDCCNFSTAGTYTAKVIVDRGSLQAETRVNIQVSPKTESEWKCPDVNGDGIVNMRDIGFVTNKTNTCSGQANYDPTADMDGDNCITTTDVNYVSKYFGKKTSEIAQCK